MARLYAGIMYDGGFDATCWQKLNTGRTALGCVGQNNMC